MNLRVVNRTRGTLLGDRILLVDSLIGRLRGFLGRPEPRAGEGIMLLPCSGVHMYGMRFALDLIFLDDRGHVVETIKTLEPWQRSGWIRDARSALEIPPGTIEATRTRVGDRLVWRSAEPHFHPSDGLAETWYGGSGDGNGSRQPTPERGSEEGGESRVSDEK